MPTGQALIVQSPFRDEALDDLFALEDELIAAVNAAGAGEFDGNEIGAGRLILYFYGNDCESILKAVRPALLANPITSSAQITLRFGPPGSVHRIEQL